MSQQEELPTWWIEVLGSVADPTRPYMIYGRGTVIKVNWPLEFLKELWLNGKAVEVTPPAELLELP